MRIAFYAPLKSPDHPVPSGDRQMARQIIAALESAGHEVRLACGLRTYAAEPDSDALAELKRDAARETARILTEWTQESGWRPDLWLTYHNYYRAPDLIGPDAAQGLAIPYCGIEASFAAKRRTDVWADWNAAAETAIRKAQLNFFMTETDRQGLAELVPAQTLVSMPPFIDTSGLNAGQAASASGPVRFVTVAMMRTRAKLESYRLLARALSHCHFDWHLEIVGDGPERAAVEALFAPFGPRVGFAGECDRAGVAAALQDGDIFVWPGVDEAYGLVYLEAQAAGLPVVALDRPPQHAVVRNGETGLLAGPGARQIAAAMTALAGDAGRRARMGQAAADFVAAERNLATAGRRFDTAFAGLAKRLAAPARIPAGFPQVAAALDRAAGAGRRIDFWLRDDDCVMPTNALDTLVEMVCGRGLALTLAVIPALATEALRTALKDRPRVDVATHGHAHVNHAPAGTKSSEFGTGRARAEVDADLAGGAARMKALFAGRAMALFVPPWNRIDAGAAAALAAHGYTAISTFGAKGEAALPGLMALPAHVDLMDWGTRTGRAAEEIDAELAGWIVSRLAAPGGPPLGLLTHHLVHDASAWGLLEALAELLAGHSAANWISLSGLVPKRQ